MRALPMDVRVILALVLQGRRGMGTPARSPRPRRARITLTSPGVSSRYIRVKRRTDAEDADLAVDLRPKSERLVIKIVRRVTRHSERDGVFDCARVCDRLASLRDEIADRIDESADSEQASFLTEAVDFVASVSQLLLFPTREAPNFFS